MTEAKDLVAAMAITAIPPHPALSRRPLPRGERADSREAVHPETYGVPAEEIVRGIRHGVRKVNIDTDLRLAAVAEIRRVATQARSEFDPRKFFKPVMGAMSQVCRDRFEAFGTAGHASKIRVVPLSEMAKRYASGSLAPRGAVLQPAE